jgi:pimeloyl-ACP methyl ester carboxylesterase
MRMVMQDGASIYYEIHGKGPAILLTHGFSQTSRMWTGQIEAWSRRHTLILWDMRGHGLSKSPEDPAAYSEASTVSDMAAVLDAAGAERAVIAGLSLGGYMSLAFCTSHPDRATAIIAIDTGPGYRDPQAREKWNAHAVGIAERYEREGLSTIGSRDWEIVESRHRSADGLAKAARGMLTRKDSRVVEALSTIAVPALVAVGADDKLFLSAADYMASRIPGARKIVIPDAGHNVNLDQPEAFNAAVLDFLDEIGW